MNRWETTATPSVAALLVTLEGDNAWAAGRGGKRHTFFSLWEKYPSEAMGDEGLVNSNAGSKNPSPASLALGCPLPKGEE